MYKPHNEKHKVGNVKDSQIFGYKILSLQPLSLQAKSQQLIQNIIHPVSRQSLDLCSYVIEPLRKELQFNTNFDYKQFISKTLGCFYGLAVGDAIGLNIQGKPLLYNRQELTTEMKFIMKLCLKPGNWSGHTSQALCLADSLLKTLKFDALDFNLRIAAWWYGGYNNSFRLDYERKSKKTSFGIRNTSKILLKAFILTGSLDYQKLLKESKEIRKCDDLKKDETIEQNDNQPLTRIAPLAIWCAHLFFSKEEFNQDMEHTLNLARLSSFATQRGFIVAECCALLMMFLIRAIHTGDKIIVFKEISLLFKTTSEIVNSIAKCAIFGDFDGNWKDELFQYNKSRAAQFPQTIGRFCCDALTMSFHCIWTTKNFRDAVIKGINLGGDSSAIGAIIGTMAGALYGKDGIPSVWLNNVLKWDGELIFRRCVLLRENAILKKIKEKKDFIKSSKKEKSIKT